MAVQHVSGAQEPAKASLLYDPKVSSIFFQVVLVLALIFGVWWIVDAFLIPGWIRTHNDVARRKAYGA